MKYTKYTITPNILNYELLIIPQLCNRGFKTYAARSMLKLTLLFYNATPSADPEGGGGGQGIRTPPGKLQVIWVSIGHKQLDPSGKSLDPPGKCWTPSGTLKNDRFH